MPAPEPDELDPAIELTISKPTASQSFTGPGPNITVSGTAVGVRGATVEEVRVRIGDGADWHQATGTAQWTYTGPIPHNGSLHVAATASGGEESVSEFVSINCQMTDVTPPTIAITTPANGARVSGDGRAVRIPVTVDAADDFLGIASVSWSVEGISLAYEAFTTPIRAWRGSRTLELGAVPKTDVVIAVSAVDAAGNPTEQTVAVQIDDVTAPFVTIDVPTQDAKIPLAAVAGGITVKGTASDLESGVVSVEVALDGGSFGSATLTGSAAAIEWARTVPSVAPGRHTLTVRGTDSAGNTRAVTAAFEVARPYQRRDALELFSQGAYLDDLLWFASTHLVDEAGQALSVERLTQVFCQPFEELKDPHVTSAGTPVNEVRPVIEVLRRFLESPDSGLVAHFRFDEGTGTTTADTTTGGVAATLAGPAWTDGRTGGPALLFDGVNNTVKVNANQRLRDIKNTFTVAFWALPLSPRSSVAESATGITGIGGQRYAFGPEQGGIGYGSPDHAGVGISVGTNGVSVFEHSDNYLPALLVHDTSLNGWTHIAVTYYWEPGDLIFGTPAGWRPTLYINGALVKAGVLTSKSAVHCVPADIGASASGYGAYHGRLDDVRIYDRVLFAGQIAVLAGEKEYAAARSYAAAAYRMLLTAIGTSYEELRLARSSESATRQALAERLGFDLDPVRPDRLDNLTLGPDESTEAFLEKMFGLVDTTGDPLRTPPVPALRIWRQERQRRLWREADHPPPEQRLAPLVVDPDLLRATDFRNQVGGDKAYDLWTSRRAWVDAAFADIKSSREGLPAGTTALTAFDTIVADVLGVPTATLTDLAADRKKGVATESTLDGLYLGTAEFNQLLRMRELAGTNLVAADEWEELYHLLTQVRKGQERAAWRQSEATLALTPEHFVVSSVPWQPVPWRAYPADRAAWQERLQARIDQEAAVGEALAAAVEEVEQRSLTLLRDGLLTTVGTTSRDLEAERLTELLFVDFSSSGSQPTTRIAQAIEVLQQLVLGLRSGRLPESHPARNWKIEPGSVDSFDEEWTWMGAYEAWRAAIFVFNFPEDLLAPTLRDPDSLTPAFKLFLAAVRGQPRIRPDVARSVAQDYLDGIRPMLENFPVSTFPPAGQGLRDQLLDYRLTDELTAADLAVRMTLTQGCLIHLSATHPTLPNYLQELFYYVPMVLAQALQKAGDYVTALDWYRTVYAYHLSDLPDFIVPIDERKIYYGLGQEYNATPSLSRGTHWLRDQLNPHVVAADRPNPYTRYTFASIIRCFLEYGDSEFARDTGESRARARSLYLAGRALLRAPELITMPGPTGTQGLTSPVLVALNARVDNQLRKLRQGRNITGMKRQVDAVTGPAVPGGSVVDAGGHLIVPALVPLRPTPYRFSVLMERCKQLASAASQMEASYLSALEKRDANAYDRLKAGFDLDISRAGQQLQARRMTEAQDTTEQARRQRAVEDIKRTTYQKWIDDGPNEWERSLVNNFNQAREYRDWVAGLDAVITAASALASVMSYWGAAAAGAVGTAATARAVLSTQLNKVEQDIQLNTLRASQARRQDEWQLQVALSIQDALVAEQGIQVAVDHEAVVAQEARIADLQTFQSQTVADFLSRKFTNTELYEWMSDVLGGVYAHFLQQATGVAQLAQSQLAFERQQFPASFIQADYWRAPDDLAATSTNTRTPDRRGLTGSARLLQDIQRLEQFAFEQDRRKLNLTQTFSLAQMAPFDFERFRETGVLPFATPMELFDRAFPGHYLRLIKRVRASLVALVPPSYGIRATLTTSGVSRVVTGPETFSEIVIRRDPESVAFTSPINASGVFDLDPQAEMLLPFESMGVATSWEFQLPKSANQFDFRTIADLLLTVEYTALGNLDYQQQVVQRLDPRVRGDRLYSFRDHFPDVWYELNNPQQSATPMTVKFDTRRADFPPNVDEGSLRIDQLLLYVKQAAGKAVPVLVDRCTLQPTRGASVLPSGSSTARSTDTGLISTRTGNWNWLSGASAPVPVAGTWTLTFAAETAQRFTDGEIEDILFAITYSGRAPAWPNA
jgi:hypothetical protein